MEINFTFILIILLIFYLIYTKWLEMKNWEIVYEAAGMHMDEAQARFAFLKQRGVRCRLKTITPMARRSPAVSPVLSTTVRLLVHKDDVQNAYELFRESNWK